MYLHAVESLTMHVITKCFIVFLTSQQRHIFISTERIEYSGWNKIKSASPHHVAFVPGQQTLIRVAAHTTAPHPTTSGRALTAPAQVIWAHIRSLAGNNTWFFLAFSITRANHFNILKLTNINSKPHWCDLLTHWVKNIYLMKNYYFQVMALYQLLTS